MPAGPQLSKGLRTAAPIHDPDHRARAAEGGLRPAPRPAPSSSPGKAAGPAIFTPAGPGRARRSPPVRPQSSLLFLGGAGARSSSLPVRRRRARRVRGCRRAPVSGGVHRCPLWLSRFSLSGLLQRGGPQQGTHGPPAPRPPQLSVLRLTTLPAVRHLGHG
ncbi:hypothetical protein NDU88_002256 [Pleurodeles waltl]|uniref:Uncharacterized protein n=1 Tax=Pleurodeles waltl TaxID=8319 RepID=A0AAV7TK95_PLEWA|nr:hypothetical protein NDU88_002256 [Pleurodeles waltl]